MASLDPSTEIDIFQQVSVKTGAMVFCHYERFWP